VRHLLLHPRQTLRTVQKHILLLPPLHEVGVEEAQEGLQGTDEGGGE